MTTNDNKLQEIQITEETLQYLGWILCGLAAIFVFIGLLVSPIDDQGRPVLLLPDVKAVEEYRKQAQNWLLEIDDLDGEVINLLAGDQQGDLFSKSRIAQNTLEHAVKIAQEVDRCEVPLVGAGFHENFLSMVLSYLEASRAALQWISMPEEENLNQAVELFESSRQMKAELEINPWLTSH